MEALCVFRGLSCATAWTPQWRCDSRAFRHAEETQFAPLTWHNLSMCGLECVEDTWWNSLLVLLVIPLGPSGDPTLSTAEFRWSAALQREAVLDDILQTLRLPGKFISSLVPKRKKTEKKSQGTQRAPPFSWSEPLEVGGVVEAAAASVWTWGGIKYSFLLTGEKGGWRVRGRCCLVAEGEHEKMVWTRAGQGWAGGVQGLQTASLPEGWRPADSSPRLCLYLWVTWLLRRPGNVCSVSVLNEPPSRDRQSYIPHTVAADSLIHGGGLCPDSSTR